MNKNIHIISDSLKINSGFSNVTRNLIKYLTDIGYNMSMTGMQTTYVSEYYKNVEVMPMETFYIDELSQVSMNIQKSQAQIIFSIFQADADLGFLARSFLNTIWYVPVEGYNIPLNMISDIITVKENNGLIVAQTKYGADEISKRLYEHTKLKIDIPFIYHGYDPNIFKPLKLNGKRSKIENAKYCYFKTDIGKSVCNPILICQHGCNSCKMTIKEQIECPYYEKENIVIIRHVNGKQLPEHISIDELPSKTAKKFVFGFVGQNLGVRKRIERLIHAYAIFINESKEYKDRTILHLHTMPISIQGIDLVSLIYNYGIQDNIIFSFGDTRSSSWSEEAMNILFNTFHCNVSASSAEGFGLPTLESMACGIANIGPNFSSFTELIGNNDKPRGLLTKISDVQMNQNGSYRCLVSIPNLVECMKTIYNNDTLRNEFSNNAIEFAKDFTWEKVCKQWDDIIKNFKLM